MLLTRSEIEPLLACPRCHGPLSSNGKGAICSEPTCGLSKRGPFSIIDEWMLLVDFDSSVLVESELKRRAGASPIPRSSRRGLKERADRLLFPPNNVARRMVEVMRRSLASGANGPATLLIVGGGSVGSGVEAIYADDSLRVVSFDIYGTAHTQFIADAHQIPLLSESVDAVLIQAVLEHVLTPWKVVEEIYRVLRPNGLVYADTPFLQQVHEGPYDFTRFTESGHRWLFKSFERIDSGVVAGPGTQLHWSIQYVARGLFRSFFMGRVFKLCFFWVRYLDRIIPSEYSVDCASAVYFYGRKALHEVTPREMIDHYRGAQ